MSLKDGKDWGIMGRVRNETRELSEIGSEKECWLILKRPQWEYKQR